MSKTKTKTTATATTKTDSALLDHGAPKTGGERRTGGCHCGAVRYAAELDLTQPGSRCNCSICTKVSPTGAMLKPAQFELLQGKESLGTYVWGSGMSKRFFCKHCGVHCYGSGHLAELGGDFVSVNLNTVDDLDLSGAKIIHWDGRNDNWQSGPRDQQWPQAPRA